MNTETPRVNTTGLPIPGTIPDLVATLINGLRNDPYNYMKTDMYGVEVAPGFPRFDHERTDPHFAQIIFDATPDDIQLSTILTAYISAFQDRVKIASLARTCDGDSTAYHLMLG